MRNKRIVFLFRDMGTGGAQKIEAFVANTLFENGYDVIAVNMAKTPCTVNIRPEINIVDLVYDAEGKNNPAAAALSKATYLLKMRRLLQSFNPDLVCAFLSDVVRIAALALKGTGIPLIGSERGDPYVFTDKQFKRYKKAYEACAGAAFQLENVAKKYDLPKKIKQKVIPNPCIPRKTAYAERTKTPEKVIISAGRLAEQKRFDVLIDAFAIVHARFPEYQLRIYGDGPLWTVLQEQREKTDAKEAIALMGDVPDVFNVAKDAEFFVLSSDFEGIPNVVIEAMSSGMACVATDCSPGGARFLLNDGERGLIVPCGDSAALAEAMMQYIQDPELRRIHEEKGLRAVVDFEPQNIKNMWLAFFEECLKI